MCMYTYRNFLISSISTKTVALCTDICTECHSFGRNARYYNSSILRIQCLYLYRVWQFWSKCSILQQFWSKCSILRQFWSKCSILRQFWSKCLICSMLWQFWSKCSIIQQFLGHTPTTQTNVLNASHDFPCHLGQSYASKHEDIGGIHRLKAPCHQSHKNWRTLE